jgi:hypothetical protein
VSLLSLTFASLSPVIHIALFLLIYPAQSHASRQSSIADNSLQANAGNQTAMNLLAQAPSTIVNPVYFTMNNIRPYNQPVAQAITLVGAIYLLIFSFIVTMVLFPIREIM